MSPEPRYEWRDPVAPREAAPAAVADDKRVEGLQKRIEKLERENRRWGVIAALVMAGFSVIILLIARATKPTDDLRTKKLTIADADGVERAAIQVSDAGYPSIVFFDQHHRRRIEIGLPDGQTPSIVFNGGNEKPRLKLAIAGEAAGSLAFLDRDGTKRASVGVDADGAAGLTIQGTDGRLLAALLGGENRAAGLSFWGRKGQERIGIGMVGEASTLRLIGGPSEGIVQLSVNASGLPDLRLTDRERGARIVVVMKPDGTPSIQLVDKAGYSAAVGSQKILLGKDQVASWSAP